MAGLSLAAAGSQQGLRLNVNNPSVKRIMKEYHQFLEDPCEDIVAAPLDENIFEWHFTLKGTPGTEYDGGVYHGRVVLPAEYPFKPPDIIFLTPSGRFQVNQKICLSITGFHPQNWQPSWGLRTTLTALRAFLPTAPKGAIGSLDYTKEQKMALAAKSGAWTCETCGKANTVILRDHEERIKQKQLEDEEDDDGDGDGEAKHPTPTPVTPSLTPALTEVKLSATGTPLLSAAPFPDSIMPSPSPAMAAMAASPPPLRASRPGPSPTEAVMTTTDRGVAVSPSPSPSPSPPVLTNEMAPATTPGTHTVPAANGAAGVPAGLRQRALGPNVEAARAYAARARVPAAAASPVPASAAAAARAGTPSDQSARRDRLLSQMTVLIALAILALLLKKILYSNHSLVFVDR